MVTPAPPSSVKGNGVTAQRWTRILRSLGHRVSVMQTYQNQATDLLVALHARRSAVSVKRFRDQHPNRPLILAMTGTDLYGDLRHCAKSMHSLALASRVILLQPDGIDHLPTSIQGKARVILQSAKAAGYRPPPLVESFEVCVASHLRQVKDPLRTAMASRLLPSESRIRVSHYGIGLQSSLVQRADIETRNNPRYRWYGAVPKWKLKQRLARSKVLALTSQMEGGANVVSEAIVAGIPVISSRISGSIGLLGPNYPAYFEVGNTQELAELMWRVESEPKFYRQLCRIGKRLEPRFRPAAERQSWANLLAEFDQS